MSIDPLNERSPGEITARIRSWREEKSGAFDELLRLVQDDLRKMARIFLRNEKPDVLLQTTLLIDDVCLELHLSKPRWENREQFFGFAGFLMRRLLIDYSRRRNAGKRGGDVQVLPLLEAGDLEERRDLDPETLIALEQVLDRLREFDPEGWELVELKFVLGFTIPEIARELRCSPARVKEKWKVVHAWIARELGADPRGQSSRAPLPPGD